MSQHDKIKELMRDGEWHCQVSFWNLYIRSPHKRRSEIEKEGEFYFEDRPCEHHHKLVRDYRMLDVNKEPTQAVLS